MDTQIKIGDHTITKAYNDMEYIVDGPDFSVIAQEYMLEEMLEEIIATCNRHDKTESD